jgi:Eco57I restriction-modification methylase
MNEGGFDVVIGNPPYVARKKIKSYSYKGFITDELPDIYAPCTERASQIAKSDGRFSLILPISAQFGDEFEILRDHLNKRFGNLWVSTFSRNPAALFSAGLGVRSTIIVGARGDGNTLHTTKTHRWYDEYRPALFETLNYMEVHGAALATGWLRPTSEGFLDLVNILMATPGSMANVIRPKGKATVGFKTTALYWLSLFLDDPPSYELNGSPTPQTKVGHLRVDSEREALITLAILTTKLSFVWWYCTGDDFDVTGEGLKSLPIDPLSLSKKTQDQLHAIAKTLIADFPQHVMFTKYSGKWMGNFVHSEMRDITDKADLVLAKELGYEHLLPSLDHAYHCVYKPTGERNGTLRKDPFAS